MATKVKVFSKSFGTYVSEGDKITVQAGKFTATATLYLDDDSEAPWDREDGHGPVSDWTSRSKRPGERVLSEDHGSHRYYDFAEAVKIARKDGWDTKPYNQGTAKERATRATEADYVHLKAWSDDEWAYFGVAVTIEKAGVQLTGEYDHAVWGIEGNYPDSDNSYFLEVANELLPEALEAARAKLKALCA